MPSNRNTFARKPTAPTHNVPPILCLPLPGLSASIEPACLPAAPRRNQFANLRHGRHTARSGLRNNRLYSLLRKCRPPHVRMAGELTLDGRRLPAARSLVRRKHAHATLPLFAGPFNLIETMSFVLAARSVGLDHGIRCQVARSARCADILAGMLWPRW